MSPKQTVVSQEIKEQILKRIREEGVPIAQAAQDHGLHPRTIYVVGTPFFVSLVYSIGDKELIVN